MSDRTIGCAHCAYQRTEQDAARWLATREKLAALLDAQKRVIDAARAWHRGTAQFPMLDLADAVRALDKLEAGE